MMTEEQRLSRNAYMRKWNELHPGKNFAANKKWKENNRERYNATQREYYKRPDVRKKRREMARKWAPKHRAANRSLYSLYQKRRNAKAKSNGGSFTNQDWYLIIERQKGRCVMCGLETKLTVDHIIPVSKGGTSYPENIQGLCLSCNCSKKDRISPIEKEASLAV